MTKLIELTEENSMLGVRDIATHIVEVDPPKVGENFVGFCRDKELGGLWFDNDPADAECEAFIRRYRYARAATPAEIASQAQPSEVVVSIRWELETWHADTEEWMTSYFDTEAKARMAMDQRKPGTAKRLIEVTVSESRRIMSTELVPHAAALSGKAVRE